MSIDREELNESQQISQTNKIEHIIPLPMPVKSNANIKKKPLRQVISFDKNESKNTLENNKRKLSQPSQTTDDSTWNSAPATCLNSPDPKTTIYQNPTVSNSEPTSSEIKSIRQFFPDSVRTMDSPSQILSRLSECAKEIFSSSHSVDATISTTGKDDISVTNLKISESDSEEVAGSIDGSTSCLELCFTEDEAGPDDKSFQAIINKKEKEYLALQLKCSQIEIAGKERVHKLEKVVLDLSK